MPVKVSREQSKMDVVVAQGVDGEMGKAPEFQTRETYAKEEYTTVPIVPTPATTSFSDGREIIFDLEPNDCGEIKNLELRFTLSSASGITLVPGSHLINRIVMEANKSMGDEIARIYPLSIQLYQYLTESQEQIKMNQKHSGYKILDYNEGEKQRYRHGEYTKIEAGEQKHVYLQLPLNFLQMGVVDFRHISQAVRFRIELNQDVDAGVGSGSGDLSLDDLNFVVRSVITQDADRMEKMKIQEGADHKYIYLDVDRLVINDKNLQPGVVTKYALDHFIGDCAFMAVVFKNTTSPSGVDKYDYYEVGYGDAQFDMTNSSGASLMGNGTPLPAEQLYKHWSEETNQPPLAGVYVVPFGESIHDSLMGVRNGYHRFDGQKDFLEVKFSNSGVSEEYTISTNGVALTSGRYRFTTSKGHLDRNTTPFAAAAPTMSTFAKRIQSYEEKDYTPTFTGNGLDSDTNVTVTFDQYRDGNVGNDVGQLMVIESSDENGWETTLVKKGRVGWQGSSNRTCEIYMWKYKELTITKDGMLKVRDF